jgi:transcriptional regulator with XRE-family HTH domain
MKGGGNMPNNLGNKETMAKNIQYYMDVNHVNSADMCRILNVPQSTFSYWLHAKTYPRIDKIEKMASFFGITKADLVEERGSVPSLSAGHSQLIQLFDSLPPASQEAVLVQLRALAQFQKAQDDR